MVAGIGLPTALIHAILLLLLWPVQTTRAEPAYPQSIHPAGTTVSFAQALTWLDASHFSVGRWDGTITIFRTPSAGEFGPVAVQAMTTPSGHGVEMLATVDKDAFVSSDAEGDLIVWKRSAAGCNCFEANDRLSYDPSSGVADSGLTVSVNGKRYLLTGHANGVVLFWEESGAHYTLVKTVDVHSLKPPANPWGLKNVRGLAFWHDAIVTASEDGDIVALALADGSERFRVRYNDKAQRGINSLSIQGDTLLIANCAVGSSDKNLWLFDLSSGTPVLKDAENLALDLTRSQVFDFSAALAVNGDGPLFFASTEEGLLWEGRIDSGHLLVTGITKSSSEGGSVVALSPDGELVAAVTHAIRLFKTR